MNKKQKTEKRVNRAIKKQRQGLTRRKRKKYVKCICKRCFVEVNIHINICNSELYTPERIKNFVCLNCKNRRGYYGR